MKVKSERSMSWPEARHILESKSKTGELGYEQKKAFEHLNKFSKMTKKDLKEALERLTKIEKLNEKHIISILSFMPAKKEEINLLFANEHIILAENEKDEILKVTEDYNRQ